MLKLFFAQDTEHFKDRGFCLKRNLGKKTGSYDVLLNILIPRQPLQAFISCEHACENPLLYIKGKHAGSATQKGTNLSCMSLMYNIIVHNTVCAEKSD